MEGLWKYVSHVSDLHLNFSNFSGNINSPTLKQHIIYKHFYIKLTIPVTDDGTIYHCLKSNNKLYRQDEEDDKAWYIIDPVVLRNHELPAELRSAYIANVLHEEMAINIPEANDNFPIKFKWKYVKRSWLNSSKPIFIDIGPSYMIYAKEINPSGNCMGSVITKRKFLNRYRIRKPSLE